MKHSSQIRINAIIRPKSESILLWLVLIITLSAISPAYAQTAAPDTTENPWTRSWVLSLNANQYNYADWSYGGNNAFAFTAGTVFQLRYEGESYLNTSRVRIRFGQSRLKEGELEKIEDLIRLSNRTEYQLKGDTFSAFLELAFRTQFAEGFDPVTNERTSAFLSPGYYIENLGLAYKPTDYFSTYLGAGLKQTVVEIDGLDRFYGLGEDEDVRSEGGLTFSYEFDKEILPGISLASEFNAFWNLLIPVQSTDIFMYNTLTGSINDYFETILNLDLMYDDDFGKVLQRKTVIALGVRIKVF